MAQLKAKTTITYDNGDGTGPHTAEPGETFELDDKKYPGSYKHLLDSGDAVKAGTREAVVTPTPAATTTVKQGPLPDDFPGRDKLEDAGIRTYAQLRDAGDVTELPGIGDATAKKIADAMTE